MGRRSKDKPFVDQFILAELRPGLVIPVYCRDFDQPYGQERLHIIPVIGNGSSTIPPSKVVSLITAEDLWHRYLKGVAINGVPDTVDD